MSSSDLEALARALINTPQGAKVIQNMDKLADIVNTSEGREIIRMLGSDGGDALKKAAAVASGGDSDAAKSLISSLLSTPQGAALISKIVGIIGK